MKRYKSDINKIKASDEIKQQTISMMQKSLQSKNISYKRNFRLALSASFVLFFCTAILSAAFVSQRIDNKDIPLESKDQVMQMEPDEIPEDMMAKSEIMQTKEFEPMMIAEFEQESLSYDQNRIICGKIMSIDEAFIEVDGRKVYTDNYTYNENDILVGSNVEVLVYYVDNKPYVELIELSEN